MLDSGPRHDRTALIVDDDVFIVSALAELLDHEGYDVHTTTNGFSALRLAAGLRPLVILLDLALPERSGQELLADLRADPTTRDAGIVVVTGYTEALSEAELSASDGVVGKPFDIDDLLQVVNRAAQRAACRRAEVAPVSAPAHATPGPRVRHTAGGRRTRGRL